MENEESLPKLIEIARLDHTQTEWAINQAYKIGILTGNQQGLAKAIEAMDKVAP